MSGTDIFIDTNICIYLLNGDVRLSNLLQDQNIYISFITEIELFAHHGHDNASVKILNAFIDSVTVINITNDIKQTTINLRREHKLKLPDSIIAASALTKNLPFVTADKGFKKIAELDLVLYELS
ncbi:type II toxin-antitoxin system VapC family toxin [Mucilaginibacter sp.]|jgi:hypothetical protein|uniref:type II toxin-antitoxin system VapC family toxin n=1 Tax=Mucilaginibacter sp. TaxID=1882438 RepID=UPI003564B59F